jgi:hypothetical protein
VRPAEDGADAALARERGQIERAVELVALDAHEREQDAHSGGRIEKREIREVCPNVLVHGVDLAGDAADPSGGQAPDVGDGAVGHEAPAEALDETVGPVLARLDDDDPKGSRAGHEDVLRKKAMPAAARAQGAARLSIRSGGLLLAGGEDVRLPQDRVSGDRVPEKGNTMPQTQHVEKHFTSSASIRDVVIGMSDGLTVPFALAAGLSGAVDSTRVVITAGLAEIAAGSIAMGLGGYLAARTDAEHYVSERAREFREKVLHRD